MGHSFTTFHEKHIRSKDYKVETWLLLIVNEVRELKDVPEWLPDACEYWEGQGLNGVNGCIDPNLDEFLLDDRRIEIFIELCTSVYLRLERYGSHVPKDFLNSLHGLVAPNDIREDNESEIYLEYGRKLIALVKGHQTETSVNA